MKSIFIPDKVENAGLLPSEYRIYVHIARETPYTKTLASIIKHCQIHKSVVSRSIKRLLELGLIETYEIQPSEVMQMLCQKLPQEMKQGKYTCEWCKCSTIALQEHHYPLPRRLNGTQIVNICANCHFEFHQLADTEHYRVTRGDRK